MHMIARGNANLKRYGRSNSWVSQLPLVRRGTAVKRATERDNFLLPVIQFLEVVG